MNVVDPHIKKEWLFHHLDGKRLNDQRSGFGHGVFPCQEEKFHVYREAGRSCHIGQ